MEGMSRRAVLILGMTALILVTPSPLRAWGFDHASLKRVPLPFVLHLAAADSSADLDGDGVPERLMLTQGRATIWTGNQVHWQSPQAWRVAEGHVTDLNQDGHPEVSLLVWRPFKPWPVDAWLPHGGRIEEYDNEDGMSCHIILIGWKQDAYQELWAGSAMANPIESFTAADLLGDGKQYLVALEGDYQDPRSASAHHLKIWEWNGFGFTAVQELDEPFTSMGIAISETENRQEVIIAP
jgi:hypothetical protein